MIFRCRLPVLVHHLEDEVNHLKDEANHLEDEVVKAKKRKHGASRKLFQQFTLKRLNPIRQKMGNVRGEWLKDENLEMSQN